MAFFFNGARADGYLVRKCSQFMESEYHTLNKTCSNSRPGVLFERRACRRIFLRRATKSSIPFISMVDHGLMDTCRVFELYLFTYKVSIFILSDC